MKQIDKYFSFISDAVSRPEENAEFYYFLDSERKKLVIVKNKSIGEIDKGYISKLIGLPFLSLKEKIAFLKDYSKNSNDSKIKLIINNYLSEFDENSIYLVYICITLACHRAFKFRIGIFIIKP